MNKPATIDASSGDKPWRARFTTAEFLRMGELGAFRDMKVELVHGELERMNPPMSMHALMQGAMIYRLSQVVTGPCRVLSEVGVDLGDDTVRGCDGAIVREMPASNRLLTPADIVLLIEVAETTLSRDLGDKLVDYAAAAIPHYWVVDRAAAVVHVYSEPKDGEYCCSGRVRFGEPLAVPGTNATITLD